MPLTVKTPPTMAHTLVMKCMKEEPRSEIWTCGVWGLGSNSGCRCNVRVVVVAAAAASGAAVAAAAEAEASGAAVTAAAPTAVSEAAVSKQRKIGQKHDGGRSSVSVSSGCSSCSGNISSGCSGKCNAGGSSSSSSSSNDSNTADVRRFHYSCTSHTPLDTFMSGRS